MVSFSSPIKESRDQPKGGLQPPLIPARGALVTLSSIMFNGWEIQKAAWFKIDVVLSKRSRTHGLQVRVGTQKRFRKLTGTGKFWYSFG